MSEEDKAVMEREVQFSEAVSQPIPHLKSPSTSVVHAPLRMVSG
jgi:hypothetical protein